MAKFITCKFYTGQLFMTSLAAVHNFGICAFPILGLVQLNIHCLLPFSIQNARGAQEEKKKNSIYSFSAMSLNYKSSNRNSAWILKQRVLFPQFFFFSLKGELSKPTRGVNSICSNS